MISIFFDKNIESVNYTKTCSMKTCFYFSTFCRQWFELTFCLWREVAHLCLHACTPLKHNYSLLATCLQQGQIGRCLRLDSERIAGKNVKILDFYILVFENTCTLLICIKLIGINFASCIQELIKLIN
jgi:hypothetical protein